MTHTLPFAATTACQACPLRALDLFKDRSQSEIGYIQDLKSGEYFAPAGATIVDENAPNDRLFTVLSGWAFRYRTLDKNRRQIMSYGLPGDFLGLQATLDDDMGHGITALTDVTICYFEQSKLWRLYADHPRLAYDMTWLAAQQERSFEEHLMTLGRRTAFERVAYLLWHLYDRARAVGLVMDNAVALPVRQQHLADTLGLSLVHTNKTLQKIKEDGAIDIREKWLHVQDEQRLITLGRVGHVPLSRRPLI